MRGSTVLRKSVAVSNIFKSVDDLMNSESYLFYFSHIIIISFHHLFYHHLFDHLFCMSVYNRHFYLYNFKVLEESVNLALKEKKNKSKFNKQC